MTAKDLKRIDSNRKAMKGDLEKQAANIDLWYLKNHLLDVHINVSDRFLRKRIINDGKSLASSFLTNDSALLLNAIKEALNKKSEQDALLYFLALPPEKWEATEECPEGASWYIGFDLPEGVVGHLYKRSHDHNWDDGPIKCAIGTLVIRRNVKYAEDIFQRGWSHEEPFVLVTAYAVE